MKREARILGDAGCSSIDLQTVVRIDDVKHVVCRTYYTELGGVVDAQNLLLQNPMLDVYASHIMA